MSDPVKPRIYREVIDALVQMCKNGQGQIAARRAISGVWNENATQEFIPDQHEINLFLTRLSPSDREILASMLIHEVELGVFETLKALEDLQIEPFKDGYEGSPFNDFVGRLADWEWPETEQGAAANP
jgi:hypothetical protein